MNTTATKTNLAATESASQNSSGRSGINSDANTNDPVLKSLKLCQLTEIKRDLSWQISNYLFNDEPSHFQFMRTTSVGCTIYLVSLTNKLASDQSRNVQLSVAGPDQRVFLNLIDSASNLKKNLNVIIQN